MVANLVSINLYMAIWNFTNPTQTLRSTRDIVSKLFKYKGIKQPILFINYKRYNRVKNLKWMTISHVYMNKCRFLEVMWSMLFECCSFQNVKLFVYGLAAWKITCDLTNFVIQ